jgi:hypothetical protein
VQDVLSSVRRHGGRPGISHAALQACIPMAPVHGITPPASGTALALVMPMPIWVIEGIGSPRNRSADSVQLRVEP